MRITIAALSLTILSCTVDDSGLSASPARDGGPPTCSAPDASVPDEMVAPRPDTVDHPQDADVPSRPDSPGDSPATSSPPADVADASPPADSPPDTSPDVPPDRPRDTPRDVARDAPPDARRECPTSCYSGCHVGCDRDGKCRTCSTCTCSRESGNCHC
jgi:hypothetical protein